MKKLIIAVSILASIITFAGPHGGPGPGGFGGPHHGGHPHHHGSFWGHGGCNFWPSFTGAAVGTIAGGFLIPPRPVVVQPAVTPTVVVSQPVVVQQQPVQVWIPSRYETRIINGVAVQTFIPGHYEVR